MNFLRLFSSRLMNVLLLSATVFCYCPATKAQNNNSSAKAAGAAAQPAAPPGPQSPDKAAGGVAGAKTEAPAGKAKVTHVYGTLALYHSVRVTVENLPELLKEVDGDLTKIVLHLEGYPLKDLPVRRLSTDGTDANILVYDLKRSTESKEQQESWNALLGGPKLFPSPEPKLVRVSVGQENKPIDTTVRDYRLLLVSPTAYWIYVIGFLCVAAALIYLARESDLLRDPGPDPKVEGNDGVIRILRKPYSLARTQMALWFFFILASFMFIWLVSTSLYSLTGTVIGLMGISAGTGLAAAVIDSNKRGAIDNQKLELDKKRKALQAEIAELKAKTGSEPPPSNLADLKATLAKKEEALAQVQSELTKLSENTAPLSSTGFFSDILSDDNGISFHRFQVFAWTLALIVIFIASVYKVLTMPDFDGTLLVLMGISSGTYLGFKIPEPKTPPEDQTPPVKPEPEPPANPGQ